MASFGSGGQWGGGSNKITKAARGKMVKPILKKLSHSEKNSLDLDRGWDEQQVEQLEVDGGWDGGFGYGYSGQARDVSFGSGVSGLGAPLAGDAVGNLGSSFRATNLKFQHHGRSGSQTSAGSGPRGAFIHPFAQTPRTSTPPLSYANSLASFDNTNARDCSPTITENENDDYDEDDDNFDGAAASPTGAAAAAAAAGVTGSANHLHSQSNLRRPSLNSSQRTASFPDMPVSSAPSLRINTGGRSVSGTTVTSTSRFAHGSLPTGSQSDLHININSNTNAAQSVTGTLDSPTGSLHSQLSPLRSSLDMGQFPRLRSRSELDTATRQENIRVARRKFEERERVKEEKYDREMIRKRERRDNKEATRIERGEAASRPSMHRKRTPTGLSAVSAPPASISGSSSNSATQHPGSSRLASSAPAPGSSIGLGLIGRRRHTDSSNNTAANNGTANANTSEKGVGFASRRYDSVPDQTPPNFGVTVHDVQFEQTRPRRGSGAKRKTQSAWQGFLLWLRTKLLRMSSH